MIIERHFLPTQLEDAPFSTICDVDSTFYLQVSRDKINWLPLSTVLFEVNKHKLEDEKYVLQISEEYNRYSM